MPYSEEDAPFFFGREPEREIITANLMASRLTLLYGASGVGKSSVLRAGVAYHLRQLAWRNLAEHGTPEFVAVVFNSWRDDPIAGLLESVRESVGLILNGRAVAPVAPPRSLVQTLQAWTEQVDGDLLIILDQFEEYFLYHPQEDGAGTFAFEFPRAVNRLDLRVSFLLSIREDSLAKLDHFKGRIPNLFDNYLRIEHLGWEAARAAIERPIEQYNRLRAVDGQRVSIEPALVEAVLEQVKTGQVIVGQAGRGVVGGVGASPTLVEARIETPYLQLVMTRLWDEEMRAGSRTLRLETLERLGGAEIIVKTHLDAVMSALPPNEQDIAARVFHYLVTPSGTKIAHTVSDLAEYEELPPEELALVLDKLSGSDIRILRPVASPPDQPTLPRYEIFHDVLAPAILDWRARYVQAEERAKAEKQLAQERHRVTRLWLGLVGLSLLLIVMVGLAIFAVVQRNEAQQAQADAESAAVFASQQRDAATRAEVEAVAQRDAAETAKAEALAQRQIALSRELAASAISQLTVDPELSVLLAIEAVRVSDTVQAEDALRKSLLESHLRAVMSGHGRPVSGATLSPDGKFVAMAGYDGTVRVWEVSTGNVLAELRQDVDRLHSAGFSPDGKFLVTASADDTAQVWEVSTGQTIAELRGHTERVTGATFSPDGKFVVTASLDKTAQVWRVSTGEVVAILAGHTGSLFSATFSPDGKFVVTASDDNTARIWEVSTGEAILILSGLTNRVRSATFSPDGKFVVTGSDDGMARVWELSTGKLVAELLGHSRPVSDATFSPDGKFVVTASVDGTARVWEVSTGKVIVILRGHTGWVNSAAFSPDGKFVVTASGDGTARVWEVNTRKVVVELRGHRGEVNSVAFSPDGKSVVTAGDSTARVWEAATGMNIAVLGGSRDTASGVNSAAFSPDGKFVVTASVDGTARVWEIGTRKVVAELDGNEGVVNSAGFSPDGKLVVSARGDGTARVWEVGTRKVVAKLHGHRGEVNSVAFSPDGKLVVTGGADDTARVWEMSTGQSIAELRGHTDSVSSASFSPDGKLVVTGSADDTARVWEMSTGQSIAELRGHTDSVSSASFSPDGKLVVTGSDDGMAQVWEVSTGQSIAELRGHRGEVNSVAFSPDGKFVVMGSDDGTARIYACELCSPIENLLALAHTRVTRELTPQERERYLHESQR